MDSFWAFLRAWLEKNINPVFFAAMVLGFVTPYVNKAPAWAPTALLAMAMFWGCAKISVSTFKELRLSTSVWFYVVRYLLAPALFFYLLKDIDFSVAVAALLLTLSPAGVAAPALTGLVHGNVIFSLLLTVVSSLAFVVIAPFYLSGLTGREIPIDAFSLFLNLFFMIVVPLVFFAVIYWKRPAAVPVLKKNATAATAVCLFFVILIVIAKLRGQFFENSGFVAIGVLAVSVFYAIYYIVLGWGLGYKEVPTIRNAMAVTSGANNIALAIVLSTLYFPPKVQLLMVIGEVVWILSIPAYRFILKKGLEKI